MRKITTEELKTILENHKHWLNEDCDGWESMRANLSYADISHADLSGADLRYADISGSRLHGTNFHSADLRYADLSGADLRYADISHADPSGADLRYADLSGADISGADLSGADLRYADISGADLHSTIFHDTYLNNAKNVPFIPMVCPDTGSFIGWKKVKDYILKLEIPEDAKRSSATTRKCRCDKAKVLEIRNINTDECIDSIINTNYTTTTYKVGEMVYPDSFDENRWNECSNGIHFFINRQEAIDY